MNAVYFWTDLQHYHELFYQDGLDPYRVQRVAQVSAKYIHTHTLHVEFGPFFPLFFILHYIHCYTFSVPFCILNVVFYVNHYSGALFSAKESNKNLVVIDSFCVSLRAVKTGGSHLSGNAKVSE